MSINVDQFEKLSEMGISLWQHRSRDNDNDNKAPVINEGYLNIELAALIKEPLFSDIVLAAGLSIGEVTQQDDHLNLGLFNWFFKQDSAQPSDANSEITWQAHQLFTPSISKIAKSPMLKKQLWQILGSNT